MELCPCGSSLSFSECCELYIKGEKKAPTADILLRSRYAAYVKTEVDYIIRTTHPDQRKQGLESEIREWSNKTVWHQLKIVNITDGSKEDKTGFVEFIAEYSENGKQVEHHELAEFRQENGIWFFWDGSPPKPKQYVRQTPKIGRNGPCPCGSGKKFKKCCG